MDNKWCGVLPIGHTTKHPGRVPGCFHDTDRRFERMGRDCLQKAGVIGNAGLLKFRKLSGQQRNVPHFLFNYRIQFILAEIFRNGFLHSQIKDN